MQQISHKEEQVLRFLGQFQYLTVSQLVRLGVAPSRHGLYPSMRNLSNSKQASVKKVELNIDPTRGRLETIFYLSDRGVRQLEMLGVKRERIKHPKRKEVSFASDYFHRLWTVDFFVALRNWAHSEDHDLYDFHYYFQQSGGSNRNNKGGKSLSDTRLDIRMDGGASISPDGIFLVGRGEGKPVFGLFEQHNGKDTKRILSQIENHKQAIISGSPSLKYNIKHEGSYLSNRVFIAFEHGSCMKAAMRRLESQSWMEKFRNHFLFTHKDDLQSMGFCGSWQTYKGEYIKHM